MTALGAVAIGVAVACIGLALCSPVGAARPRTWRTRDAAALAIGWIHRRREAANLAAASVEVLGATHAAMRSGLPLAPALRLALERAPVVAADPFRRALRAFELNAPLDGALRDMARQATDPRVALALEALALVAAEQLPATRAAAVIGSVGDRLAFEARLAGEIRARTSGVRAQIVLLALLVPALALYLVVTLPGLGATLTSPLGLFVLIPGACLFEIAGILASRAVIRGIR